jgi:hypothetical protein
MHPQPHEQAPAGQGRVTGARTLDESHLAGSVLQQAVGKLKDALTPGDGEEATDRRSPS